jgi:HK97 family phage major capsid protein
MDVELKGVLDGISSTVQGFSGRLAAMQSQVDAIDSKTQHRHVNDGAPDTVGGHFTSSEQYAAAKAAGFGRKSIRIDLPGGMFPLERKATTITGATLGGATSGVLAQQRLPGVVGQPTIALRIRDIMRVVPQTTGNSFDYVYQSTRTNAASPQVEGLAKAQSDLDWKSASGLVRTISHYVKCSRQSLDDVPWLRSAIDGELLYGVKCKEEAEILSGDGTGVHLNGIFSQAAAFNPAVLSPSLGWSRLDILRYAKLQARQVGLATNPPSACILNPADLAEIEVTKDGFGRYLVGDAITGVMVSTVWGLPVVESDSIEAGTFLLGAFATAAVLIDRMQATVEISFSNEDDFVCNRCTLLGESRIGLAVTKPTAFIKGNFTSSPA